MWYQLDGEDERERNQVRIFYVIHRCGLPPAAYVSSEQGATKGCGRA